MAPCCSESESDSSISATPVGWWLTPVTPLVTGVKLKLRVLEQTFQISTSKWSIMEGFFDGFLAFRANKRMHDHIQNAACIAILIGVLLQLLWPRAELAPKSIILIASVVILLKSYLQPAVICYIPRNYTSEYTALACRKQATGFPRLYLAHTGVSTLRIRVRVSRGRSLR